MQAPIRLIKIFCFLCLFWILFAAYGLKLLGNSTYAKNIFPQKISKYLSTKLGKTVRLRNFSYRIPFHISFEAIEIEESDSLIFCGEDLMIDLSLLPLLEGNIEIKKFSMRNCQISSCDSIPPFKIDGSMNLQQESKSFNIAIFNQEKFNARFIGSLNDSGPEGIINVSLESFSFGFPPLIGELKVNNSKISGQLKGWLDNTIDIDMSFPNSTAFEGKFTLMGQIEKVMEYFPELDVELRGGIALTTRVSGTRDAFLWDYEGTLTHGFYENSATGTVFESLSGKFKGDNKMVELIELFGTDSKEGTINATGILQFDQKFPFQAVFKLQDARIFKLDQFQAQSTGSATLSGNLEIGKLTGDLAITKAIYTLNPDKTSVPKPLQVNFKGQREPSEAKKKPQNWTLELDLNLKTANKVLIKGEDFESEWTGMLKVNGNTKDPLYNGTLHLYGGSYLLNGKLFKLTEGSLNFAGNLDRNVNLNLVLSHEIRDVKVDLVLKGNANQPTIQLRSNPPLNQKEILSLLLFNQKGADVSDWNLKNRNSLLSFPSKNDHNSFLDKFKKKLGIDRLEIQQKQTENNQEVMVKIGKYLNKRVFVGVNKTISSDKPHVILEANLLKNFKLEAELGDEKESEFFLKWKRDY